MTEPPAADIVPGGTPDRPRADRPRSDRVRPGGADRAAPASPPSAPSPFARFGSGTRRRPGATSPSSDPVTAPGSRSGPAPNRGLASIAADGLPDEDVLYRRDGILVMPSWLEIEQRESYAVRSIVRLSLDARVPPRAPAILALLAFAVLAVLFGVYAFRGTLPFALAWGLCAASLALGLHAWYHAFVRRSAYRLDVTLADGTRVPLERRDRASLLELHRALVRAMERQRGGG